MSLNVQKFRHGLSQLEVNAVQFSEENGKDLVKWCGGQYCITGKLVSGNEEVGHSFVLPADQIASVGDYIVQGLDDVFWVTPARTFIHTYDLIVEPLRAVPSVKIVRPPTHATHPMFLPETPAERRNRMRGL